jgi:hypothetical protein
MEDEQARRIFLDAVGVQPNSFDKDC